MNNKLPILSLALAVLTASILPASPVRDYTAGKNLSYVEDDGPVNYFSWPTARQTQRKYQSPSSVWTPELGIWYVFIADNGYKDTNPSATGVVDWGEDYIVTRMESGYSAGVFLDLEPGHYILSSFVGGKAAFRLSFYSEVEGGYTWKSRTELSAQTEAGTYERVFTVPNGAALTCLIPTSGGNASSPPLTVTNIEIYRID